MKINFKRNINYKKLEYKYIRDEPDNLPIYNQKNINLLNKELYRKTIIDDLINIFKKYIIKLKLHNSYKIFKNNKLNELVHKWCWLQYNDNSLDVVIPYNINDSYNMTDFLDNLNYILASKISSDNKIIIELENKIKKFLKESYYQTLQPCNIKLVILKKDNLVTFKLYSESKMLSSIDLADELYERLSDKFINVNKNNELDKNLYIFLLIYRYSYIDSGNQQLAIDKRIKELFKEYNVDFELFGSAINVVSNYYCSLFYDIERYFGSQGNFFDIELKQGIYWCNPPYDNTIMEQTAIKLIKTMKNNINVGFLVTIPIWDKITQGHTFQNVTQNYNIKTKISDHNDYKIYSNLKPFIKDELIIPKRSIPYFNYRLNTPIYAVDTYMLLVYDQLEPDYVKPLHSTFDLIVKLDKQNYFNFLKKLKI